MSTFTGSLRKYPDISPVPESIKPEKIILFIMLLISFTSLKEEQDIANPTMTNRIVYNTKGDLSNTKEQLYQGIHRMSHQDIYPETFSYTVCICIISRVLTYGS